jgi:hypothetical protein
LREDLVNKLKRLGFNTYEAKVYLALLENGPATGYEVSICADLPQARAYETLKMLRSRGVVVALGLKPVKYAPIDPMSLLDSCQRSYQEDIDSLRGSLPALLSGDTVEPTISLRGREAVIPYVFNMIQKAQKSLLVAFCEIDAALLYPKLLEAQQRGVQLGLLSYDPCEMEGLKVYYPASFLRLSPYRLPWLIVLKDKEEGLVSMRKRMEEPPHAIVTRMISVIRLMTELLFHHILFSAFEERLCPELERLHGEDLPRFHEQFSELQIDILTTSFSFTKTGLQLDEITCVE